MSYEYFYGKQAEQYQFYKLPKILFREEPLKSISIDAKVLYSLMLDRAGISAENGWLDDAGRVYIIYTLDQICKDMSCAREKAVKLLNELEDGCGLIRRKRQRLCKPNLIYVMNFATGLAKSQLDVSSDSRIEPSEVRKPNCRGFENRTTGNSETEPPGIRKPNANKTDNNETEENNTDPILSDHEIRTDTKVHVYTNRTREKDMYRSYFQDQLDVPSLLVTYPYERERIEEIVELLTDICSGDAETILVGKTKRPGTVVRSRLMKLGYKHICYVLHSLEENHSDVRNIRQYLLTVLYNAPTTMSNYYQTKVNHDMASGAMKEGSDNYSS